MRVICPECDFERQIDAVFAGPQVQVRCSRCSHRFGVEPNTASVVGRPVGGASPGAAPKSSRSAPKKSAPTLKKSAPKKSAPIPKKSAPTQKKSRPMIPRPAWVPPPTPPPPVAKTAPAAKQATTKQATTKPAARPKPSVKTQAKARPTRPPAARPLGKSKPVAPEAEAPKAPVSTAGESEPVPASSPSGQHIPRSAAEADTLRMAAEKSFQQQQLVTAREGFEACLAFDEEHAHDHYQLGRVLVKLCLGGDEKYSLDDAKRHFMRASEIRPTRVDYFMALADLAKRGGNERLALGYYKRVLGLDATHHGALREFRLHKRRKDQGAGSASARLKAFFARAKDKPDKKGKSAAAAKAEEGEELEVEFT